MSLMYYPKLLPLIDNRMKLIEDYRYKEVLVPVGFETNGADSPRIFWQIFPPFAPKFLPAVIVHDYLIKQATNSEDVIYANTYFENIMLEIENSLKTRLIVRSVKLYWKIIRRNNVG